MTTPVTMSTRKQLLPSLMDTVWLCAFFCLLSMFFILPMSTVTALTPISVYGPAYATINENLFIIQGGADYQNATFSKPVSQFIALDLTRQSWDASNPPWVSMNFTSQSHFPEILTTYNHSMTVSLDQKTITIWDSGMLGSVTLYNLTDETWRFIYLPSEMQRSDKQLKADVDPTSGLIYLPLGYDAQIMQVYDPFAPTSGVETGGKAPQAAAGPDAASPLGFGRASGIVMADGVKRGSTGYSWMWSSIRAAFILFGGRIGEGTPNAPYLHEFKPNYEAPTPGGTWSILKTNGTVPPRLIGSCMLSAYNGTKIVLFGGHPVNFPSTPAIYILDVPTLTWTKDTSLEPALSRSFHACTVSGDNFVAWGGLQCLSQNTSTKPNTTLLIYNLFSLKWSARFERGTHYIYPPASSPTPVSPPIPESTPAPEKRSNVRAIAGSTVGAVVFVAMLAVAYIYFKQPHLLRQLICCGKRPDPVDPSPADPSPVDPSPVDLSPVDPSPVDPSPIDPSPVDPSPVDPSPVNPSSVQIQPQPSSPVLVNNENPYEPPSPPTPPNSYPQHPWLEDSPHDLPAADTLSTAPAAQNQPISPQPIALAGEPEFTSQLPSRLYHGSFGFDGSVMFPDMPPSSGYSSKDEHELRELHRSSTFSEATTLNNTDSRPTSPSPPPVPSLPAQYLSQESFSSSRAGQETFSSSSIHLTVSPSDPSQPNPRIYTHPTDTRPNHRADTGHSFAVDYSSSSDLLTPSVDQVPFSVPELPSHIPDHSGGLYYKEEIASSSSSIPPTKQPTHARPNLSTNTPPRVPSKPENLTYSHMRRIRHASRQQNKENAPSKSTQENDNSKTTTTTTTAVAQQSDPQKALNTTVLTSSGQRLPPGAVATAISNIGNPFLRRQGLNAAVTSESHAETTIVRHPRGGPVVVGAPRSYAARTVAPPTNTLATRPVTHTTGAPANSTPAASPPRPPQGGYEASATTGRNPQDARGVGSKEATSIEEDPKPDDDRKGPSDGDEWEETMKKFMK